MSLETESFELFAQPASPGQEEKPAAGAAAPPKKAEKKKAPAQAKKAAGATGPGSAAGADGAGGEAAPQKTEKAAPARKEDGAAEPGPAAPAPGALATRPPKKAEKKKSPAQAAAASAPAEPAGPAPGKPDAGDEPEGAAAPAALDLPVPATKRRFRREDWRQIPFHRLAKTMAPASPKDCEHLEISIATKGFNPEYPIWVHEDSVLDGRTRLTVCRRLGVEPVFVLYEGDCPEDFVFETNIARRQMSPGQRAWAATLLLRAYSDQGSDSYRARLRQLAHEVARRNMERAERVSRILKPAPLRDLITSGGLRLAAGEIIGQLPEEEQFGLVGKSPKEITKIAGEIRKRLLQKNGGRRPLVLSGKAAPEAAPCKCDGLLALCPYAENRDRAPEEIDALLEDWAQRWRGCGADWILFGWRNDVRLHAVLGHLIGLLPGYSYEHMITWSYPTERTPRHISGVGATSQPIFVFRRKGARKQMTAPPNDLFYGKGSGSYLPTDQDNWVYAVPPESMLRAVSKNDVLLPLAERPAKVVMWLAAMMAGPGSHVVACWNHDDILAPLRERYPESTFAGWRGAAAAEAA